MSKRLLRLAIAATSVVGALAFSPQTAGAEHGHFVYQPANGSHPATCRYIATGQTDKAPTDPGGHAFHDHVHTGRPGSDDNGTDFDKASNAANYDCEFVNSP